MSASGIDARSVGLLSTGHAASALGQGAVPALLPFLTQERGLSFVAAAALVPAVTVASAVALPLLGHLADHTPRLWVIPAGVVVSGLGVCFVGLLPGYLATVAAVVVTGVGVAVFQPYAARYVRQISGGKPSFVMSLYAVGGNVGFAIAPLVVTALVLAFGLRGTLALAVPALLVGVALSRGLAPIPREVAAPSPEQSRPLPRGFTLLLAAIGLRSLAYFGLVAFLPLFWVGVLDESPAAGNRALTIVLVAGVLGTLLVGRLGDRLRPRSVLASAMAISGVGTAALLVAPDWISPFVLMLVGAAAVGTFGLTVVMGQQYLPDRLGTAAGLTLGVSIGVGGIGTPLLGLVADGWGLNATMCSVAALSLTAAAVAIILPAASS